MKNNAPINVQNVTQKLSQEQTSWFSEEIGSFNENQVNVRFMNNIVAEWHTHSETDEMFVVLPGSVTIETEDQSFPQDDTHEVRKVVISKNLASKRSNSLF